MMQRGAEDFVKSLIDFSRKDRSAKRRSHMTRLYICTKLENNLLALDDEGKACLSIAHSVEAFPEA